MAESPEMFEDLVGEPVHYATFGAVHTGFRTDPKSGAIKLEFVVPLDQKYDAFKVTDLIGQMLEVRVYRIDYGLDDFEDFGDLEPFDE